MRLIITSFLVGFILMSLPKKGDASLEVQFQKEVVYGSNDEVIVGEVTTVGVDERGFVFIADRTQTQIHIFDPNGKYIKSLGREGKGPGEYTAIFFNTKVTTSSEKLYVTDGIGFLPDRTHVYSLDDFSFLYTIKLLAANRKDFKSLKGYSPIQGFYRTDGKYLVPYRPAQKNLKNDENSIKYFVQNSKGYIEKGPVLEQAGFIYLTYLNTESYMGQSYEMELQHSFPFFSKPLFSFSNKNRLYLAASKEFKIKVYDSDGNYLRSIEHEFENQELNMDRLIDQYIDTEYKSELGDGVAVKMLKNAEDLPKTWPALDNMFVDDENRIWVSTIVEDDEVYEWWILQNSGEIITTFKWPRDKPIETVNNSKLYTVEENPDTFEKEVVSYNIVFNK